MKRRRNSGSRSGSGSRSECWALTLSEASSDTKSLHAESLRRCPGPVLFLVPAETANVDPNSKKSSGSGLKLSSKSKISVERSLRRSPRFSSPASEGEDRSGKQFLSNLFDSLEKEKPVRRSPRFTPSPDRAKRGKLEGTMSQSQGSSSLNLISLTDKKELPLNVECLAVKCVRRSPRFYSTQSGSKSNCSKAIVLSMSSGEFKYPEKNCSGAAPPRTCNLKKKSQTEFKTKLLSHAEADAESTTLEYNDPKFSEQLRRSPRLTLGTKSSDTIVTLRNFETVSLDKKQVRSPRLSSSLSGAETIGLDSSDEQLHKKVKTVSTALVEKQVRRFPSTLPSSPLSGKNIKSKSNASFTGVAESPDEPPCKKIKTSVENFDPGMIDGKFLRRSPRTTTSFSGDEYDKMKCETIILLKSAETSASSENKQKNNQSTSPGTATCSSVDEFDKRICGSVKLLKSPEKRSSTKIKASVSPENKQKKYKTTCFFVGDPIPSSEAQERWHWRYEMKSLQSQRSKGSRMTADDDDEDKVVSNVECHYSQAKIGNSTYSLGDCAYIKGDGGEKHIGRIIEFFKTTDGENYFRVQWFYKVEDTVIKEAEFHDKKRLFYSTVMNDNLIDCILSKVSVVQILPTIGSKPSFIPSSGFYFDMEYCVEYSTFRTMLPDHSVKSCDLSPINCTENNPTTTMATTRLLKNKQSCETFEGELVLLDLYSGCGGMSTGLCLGAKNSGVNLVTRWALDSSISACESLKLNHPEIHARNESAEDFLELLKAWEKLYKRYANNDVKSVHQSRSMTLQAVSDDENSLSEDKDSNGEFEVSRLVDICYGDPEETGKRGIKFKVRWKGYSASEDTWEPVEGLSNCQERIQDFVRTGLKSKILPLPGDVDVICGGPPCQGISGYNRFRNIDSPLADERNRQIIVFMDIVQFLKPKYVLMENVVDILRFDNASLGRYALSRLVCMKYQARLGIMAAGCYGLPQFRLRFFLWGAHPSEKLPQFPLPTHDVIVRYWPPAEFERNTVAYDEDQPRDHLEKALVLQDAISDLPEVTNNENLDQMSYERPPQTEFQRYIRSSKHEMTDSGFLGKPEEVPLYDHRPYTLSEDNYLRVCLIPKRKGANFRDLPGVVVGSDNVVRRDAAKEQILLASGKPMIPDFVFTFEQGKSKRPFARLWWDETVPTVVTFPNHRNQAALHPEQDRVLTIREYARLQGFPDYYRFYGTVRERYRQIGNAVAVPVARALGYALGMAVQKLGGNEPLMTLPPKFSYSTNIQFTVENIQKPSGNEPLVTLSPTLSASNNNQLTGDDIQNTECEPPFILDPPKLSQSNNIPSMEDDIQKPEEAVPLMLDLPKCSQSNKIPSAGDDIQKPEEEATLILDLPKFPQSNNIHFTEVDIQKTEEEVPLMLDFPNGSQLNNIPSEGGDIPKPEEEATLILDLPEFPQSNDIHFMEGGIQKTEEEAPLMLDLLKCPQSNNIPSTGDDIKKPEEDVPLILDLPPQSNIVHFTGDDIEKTVEEAPLMLDLSKFPRSKNIHFMGDDIKKTEEEAPLMLDLPKFSQSYNIHFMRDDIKKSEESNNIHFTGNDIEKTEEEAPLLLDLPKFPQLNNIPSTGDDIQKPEEEVPLILDLPVQSNMVKLTGDNIEKTEEEVALMLDLPKFPQSTNNHFAGDDIRKTEEEAPIILDLLKFPQSNNIHFTGDDIQKTEDVPLLLDLLQFPPSNNIHFTGDDIQTTEEETSMFDLLPFPKSNNIHFAGDGIQTTEEEAPILDLLQFPMSNSIPFTGDDIQTTEEEVPFMLKPLKFPQSNNIHITEVDINKTGKEASLIQMERINDPEN